MWSIIVADLKALLTKIESVAETVWHLLTAYVQEAISEEEAALFPKIKAQAEQLLIDETKLVGLDVKGRVALAVAEITKDLAEDAVIAEQTLVNAYVWVVAHKIGLQDGNQGVVTSGAVSAGSNTAVTPTATSTS